MKKDSFKIILLVLVLFVTNMVVTSIDSKYKLTKIKEGYYRSNHITDENWEYIKSVLFTGKGEAEFAYKLTLADKNAPILIDLQAATHYDSLAVYNVIKELRTIIPNKKIDYFKKFSGKSIQEFDTAYLANNKIFIKGYSFEILKYSTIRLNFGKVNDYYIFDDIIKTALPDGSSIERTNHPRENYKLDFPSKVWFHLKDSLSYDKRKKYIKYELLRTFCYVQPYNFGYPIYHSSMGVFSTYSYNPEAAKFGPFDKILLKKLYEDDFLDQFRSYLTSTYSWRYANNFLDKALAKKIALAIIICIGLFVFLLSFSFFQNKKFKYSFVNYFLPVLFVMVFSADFALIYTYLTDFGINQTNDLKEFLILYSVVFISSLIISSVLWLLEKLWINKIRDFTFQLICKVISTFIAFNLPILIVLYITSFTYNEFLEFYLPIFVSIVLMSICRGVLIYLNHFSDSLVKEKDVELSRLKEINAQAETRLLQSQINPHFLYNSLNSIASLAPIDAQKTQKMAHSLSDLFKYSINRKDKKTNTILDEVNMVKTYLDIEKIRFGDRLQFTLEVDDNLQNRQIPLFLIQPLIENAVKHGISKNEGQGKIGLKISKMQNEIIISVNDNGPDFPEGLLSGHGLQTVFDLLRLTYGDKAALNWVNNPEKMIIITIPDTI